VKGITLVSLVAILAVAVTAFAGEQSTIIGNLVYFEKATARPGESFGVNIRIANEDVLAGAQGTIFFRSESIKLVCDSISFAGSRCENFALHLAKIPLVCEKCGAKYEVYNEPSKRPGICDHDGGKLTQKEAVFFFMTILDVSKTDNNVPMPPGDGLLATVYFTAPKDSPAGIVKLVRGIIPSSSVSYGFSVWDPMGTDLEGQVREGEIEIRP